MKIGHADHPDSKPNQLAFSSEGPMLMASCRSGSPVACSVKEKYLALYGEEEGIQEINFLKGIDFKFSDGESCVRLDQDVNGKDVFLFQALQDPTTTRSVDENYLAFMLALRTFREWGANRVTGVLPYLAYARQDQHTTGKREPISVELMAELSIEAGLDRLIVWAPHDNRVYGFYGTTPVDTLQANHLFMKYFEEKKGQPDLIGVAPDAGAAAFMIPFCQQMNLDCAVSAKYRPEPEKAAITDIMGDFTGKREAIILDDMINTGGTIEAVIKKLYQEKGIQKFWLGVSHLLGSTQSQERLEKLQARFGLQELVVTDSVPLTDAFNHLGFISTAPLAEPLANAIHGIHHNLPLTQNRI